MRELNWNPRAPSALTLVAKEKRLEVQLSELWTVDRQPFTNYNFI